MRHGFYSKIAAENIQKNRRLYIPRILAEAGLLGCFYILVTLAMEANPTAFCFMRNSSPATAGICRLS